MRPLEFYEVEDRVVAVTGLNSCRVFNDGTGWTVATSRLARKALVEGAPLTTEELERAFPDARRRWAGPL